jgi:hypothetical protein
MSVEVLMLVATAVLAVIAISAAVVAVRAARRTGPSPAQHVDAAAPREVEAVAHPTDQVAPLRPTTVTVHEPAPERPGQELEPRLVDGRMIVPPSQQQVVRTALGRPGVRLSVFVHGAAYALRAESRDRIAALMRREYRRRRRERLQAGRRAVRASRPPASSPDQWLGS